MPTIFAMHNHESREVSPSRHFGSESSGDNQTLSADIELRMPQQQQPRHFSRRRAQGSEVLSIARKREVQSDAM